MSVNEQNLFSQLFPPEYMTRTSPYGEVPSQTLPGSGWDSGQGEYRGISLDQWPRQKRVTWVTSPGFFSLAVTEQPPGLPSFVSSEPKKLTRFQLADRYGSVGFIAHNYLAGKNFYKLECNMPVKTVFDDLSVRYFRVVSIRKFRADSPWEVTSPMVDLRTGKQYTAEMVFREIYGEGDRMVLQTCIAREDTEAWGRLFVIAESKMNNL